MEIPKIEINDINIQKIRIWETYKPTLDLIYKPIVNIPGCVRVHRNNLPSLIDNSKDEYGTYSECGHFEIPHYEPLEYNPNKFTYIQSEKPPAQEQEFVPSSNEPPKWEPKNNDKNNKFLIDCPSPQNQRIGDFRNEKRLERVIGHKRSEDGNKCITQYENVAFKDQYIPEISSIISTAVIGLVAASSPLLLNIIKPLVKNLFKKFTKKKNKVE